MKSYTIEQILAAAEAGEVSMIDAKHICKLVEEMFPEPPLPEKFCVKNDGGFLEQFFKEHPEMARCFEGNITDLYCHFENNKCEFISGTSHYPLLTKEQFLEKFKK